MSPETFRSRALECVRLAQASRASRHRTVLLALARSWAELANAAEEFQALFERPAPARRIRVKTAAGRTRAKGMPATLH